MNRSLIERMVAAGLTSEDAVEALLRANEIGGIPLPEDAEHDARVTDASGALDQRLRIRAEVWLASFAERANILEAEIEER